VLSRLRDLLRRKAPPPAVEPAPRPAVEPAPHTDPDFDWLRPPSDPCDVSAWDRYWDEHVRHGLGPGFFDMLIDDRDLVTAMKAEGLRRVLCAGNGISVEPWYFAVGGCRVAALDLSPRAAEIARGLEMAPEWQQQVERLGGHIDYVVGDLRDPAVCPGPFDVVIERRTAQLFVTQGLDEVLAALAARLDENGIFVSHCHDGAWKPPAHPRHYTREWFVDHRWNLWNGVGKKPAGRVAWLQTTTG